MGKTKDLGHLAHIVAYNAENHITVPAGITMHTNQLVASQAWVTTALGSYALSTSLGSYVPTSRTITINGTTFDLSANRNWDITSMIYPAAGIALSTGSAWGTSITNNSGNWNTAFGWGNHASAGYALSSALSGYVPTSRTITINGTTLDLSANRSFTVTATETDTLATVTARGATTTGNITVTGYLRTSGVTSNAVLFNAGAASVDFGNAFGQGTTNRSVYFRGNTGVSAWWGGIDGNGNNIPFAAIDAVAGEFSFWRNTGGTGGGTWSNIMTMNASGLTMNSGNFIGNLTGNSSNITAFTINQNLGTSNSPSFAGLTINTGGTGTWSPFVVTSTSQWGDGGTQYVTIGAGGAAGIMINNPHVVWNSSEVAAGVKFGRSGGVSSGSYYVIGTGASNNFFINKDGAMASPVLNINSAGNATFSGTVTAPTFNGNLSGTAGGVAWGNVSGRPGWMTSASLIEGHSNANEARNSGFYENGGGGSNWPSQTWYNSINVRHSNQGNYHGFQLAMSYYDNNLWFRSYQGSGTFQSWAVAISSQNIGSQKVDGAFKLWSLTHPNDFYITHSWTGAHWFLTSNHGSAVRVGYADSAGTTSQTNFSDLSITGAANKYLTINPGNGYEAMVRYIGGSGSSWYVGKRTSGQLVGTQSFHFYSEEAGATVGGIDPGGVMFSVGAMRAPIFYDHNDTGYYLDPNSESSLYRFTSTTMTRNAMNYLSINSPFTTRAAQAGPYQNGTMGWGTVDFNTVFSNWGSGFIDTWSNPGNAPGGSSHYVGIQSCHYNHQNSANVYGFQMACAGEADNRFFWRSAWPSMRGWVEMIHTGNIASQTAGNVNNISSAVGGAYTWTGLQYFRSNRNTSTDSAPLQAFSDNGGGAIMSFHRGGHYAVNFGLDSDNVMRIGGWSASVNRWQLDMSGNMTVAGDVTAFSDARVKENVETIENALEKVLALRGVSYNRNDSDDKKKKIGVIAQETLQVVPEVVNMDNSGMYNVSYGNMGGLFIEAFKEQQKKIESQDKTIEELKELIYAITR